MKYNYFTSAFSISKYIMINSCGVYYLMILLDYNCENYEFTNIVMLLLLLHLQLACIVCIL